MASKLDKRKNKFASILEDDKLDSKVYSKWASRATVFGSFAGLYALIIVCLATTFILGDFLRQFKGGEMVTSSNSFIFSIITYSISIIFIGYVASKIRYIKWQARRNPWQSTVVDSDSLGRQSADNVFSISSDTESRSSIGGGSELLPSRRQMRHEHIRDRFRNRPLVEFNAEGISFFSRMGLLGFGIGAALLDGFRLLQYAEGPTAAKCYGNLYIGYTSLNLIFIVWLTFFLIKYHTAVLSFEIPLIKLGLLHIVAVNVSQWITTVVVEGAITATGVGEINDTTGKHSSLSCLTEKTIYIKASPYLYPFVIEFSLLAAATVYRVYCNIGTVVIHEKLGQPGVAVDGAQTENNVEVEVDCHKSHSGLFWGIVIFIGVFTASCFYIYIDESGSGGHPGVDEHGGLSLSNEVHLISDLCVSSVALVVLIPTIIKIKRLQFTTVQGNGVDQNLLIVAVVGYYLLLGLMVVPAFSNTAMCGKHGKLCQLVAAMCVLNFAQITLQVVVILDGLHRRAVHAEHENEKPGRSLLAFMIVVNLAMWVINTFLLKGVHHMEFLNEYYGRETWALMTHMVLPLSIFFRFHAAVCFSEIWQNAYTREKTCAVNVFSFMREATDL